MNKNTRTMCLETLLNKSEHSGFAAVAQELGIPMSTLNRSWINREVQRHGKPPAPPKESRACRGQGRQASRAAGFMAKRRQV